MLCASIPIQATEENVNIQIFVEGQGQVKVKDHVVRKDTPQSFTVKKGENLILQMEEEQSKLTKLTINNENIPIQAYAYPFLAKEDTTIRVQFSPRTTSRSQGVRVESFSYHEHRIPNMGTWNECIFNLNTGDRGFCGEAALAGIRLHQYLESPVIINNANIRKILYYGCLGPEDILTPRYGRDAAVCITSELSSKAYTGITAAEIIGMPGGWNNFLRPIYEEIVSKPDPYALGFTAYVCRNLETGENWQGHLSRRQDLLFGKLTAPRFGSLQIVKQSAQPEITKDNSNYSLADAQYGLYASYADASAKKNAKLILTTNEAGMSQVEKLVPATYYVREIKAPKGYAVQDEIQKVDVFANQTHVLKGGIFTDVPESKTLDLVVKKLDSKTKLPLQGAEFLIEFFKPNQKEPSQTWHKVTDENGEIRDLEVPFGILRIHEVKAPKGYVLNPEVFERNTIETYNAPEVLNTPNEFVVRKVQKGSKQTISQAEFIHTLPDGTKESVKTDDKGEIHFTKLEAGKHTLKEVKVKPGYELNLQTFEWMVQPDGTILDQKNPLIIEDEVSDYRLEILKKNEKRQPLDGAEFTIYEDQECKHAIDTQTSVNGMLRFDHLKDNQKYYVKEVKAPQGYTLPEQTHVYEIYTSSNPEKGSFTVYVDGKPSQGNASDRVVSLEIINHTGNVLPFTGSHTTMFFWFAGMACMIVAFKKGKIYA